MRLGVVVFLLAAGAQAQETPAAPPAAEAPPAELQAGQLSKLPKQTKFVEAEYPKEAFDKGITADVILLLDINEQGTVDNAGISEPATVPDMGFEDLLHRGRIDPELGGDQRRGAGRPVHPGVAGLAGEPEHQRLGARPVDQLALQPRELQPPLLRLQHLVGSLRLQEGGAARRRRRQPVLPQGVADGR